MRYSEIPRQVSGFFDAKNHQVCAGKDNFPVLLTWGLFRPVKGAALNLNLSFSLLLAVHSLVHPPFSERPGNSLVAAVKWGLH